MKVRIAYWKRENGYNPAIHAFYVDDDGVAKDEYDSEAENYFTRDGDYFRITEYVTVDLPPREQLAVLMDNMKTIDSMVNKLRAEHELNVGHLLARKQELLRLEAPSHE